MKKSRVKLGRYNEVRNRAGQIDERRSDMHPQIVVV